MRLYTDKSLVVSLLEVVIPTVVSVGIGTVFIVSNSIHVGLLAFFISLLLAFQLTAWITTSLLPSDARICAEVALRQFQNENPNAKILCVSLRDKDQKRFIITISHQGPVK